MISVKGILTLKTKKSSNKAKALILMKKVKIRISMNQLQSIKLSIKTISINRRLKKHMQNSVILVIREIIQFNRLTAAISPRLIFSIAKLLKISPNFNKKWKIWG